MANPLIGLHVDQVVIEDSTYLIRPQVQILFAIIKHVDSFYMLVIIMGGIT